MKISLPRKPKKDGAPVDKKGGGSSAKLTKGKKEHFTLFLGDDGAILIYMEGSTVVRRLFAPTATLEHTKTMKELMTQHPKAAVRVIMDVIDQQYVRQTFPPVSPLSVGGLVDRRMKRDFPAEDLKGSIRLGREATARKDWIYLLVDLANTTNFQQWIELIIDQPNRLLGVYLLPLESEHFISVLANAIAEKPGQNAPWQMLISHNKVSGFRIVVLRDGKLTFSRIGQAVGESVPAVLAGNVEQEIQNTIEYIRRLGYSEGAGLDIYAIMSAEVRDAIDPKRINASTLHLLSPYDIAELLKLKQAALAADRFGDVVLAASLSLINKTRMLLKPAYAKKVDQIYMAQMGLRGVAAIVIISLLWLTGKSIYEVLTSKSATNKLEASLQQNRPTLNLLRKQVEQLGVDVNTKSDVVVFFNTIKPAQYSPVDALNDLAKLQYNRVSIEEWEWTGPAAGSPIAAAPAASPEEKSYPVEIKAKAQMLGSFPDNQTVLEAVTDYKLYLSSNIKEFKIEIPSADLSGGGSKISVAITGTEPKSNEVNQAPTLNVVMNGPLSAATPNAPPVPAAMP